MTTIEKYNNDVADRVVEKAHKICKEHNSDVSNLFSH